MYALEDWVPGTWLQLWALVGSVEEQAGDLSTPWCAFWLPRAPCEPLPEAQACREPELFPLSALLSLVARPSDAPLKGGWESCMGRGEWSQVPTLGSLTGKVWRTQERTGQASRCFSYNTCVNVYRCSASSKVGFRWASNGNSSLGGTCRGLLLRREASPEMDRKQ